MYQLRLTQSAVEDQQITAPTATAQWLSCYLRGRQAKTCFRGVRFTSRKVSTGVPQGSKLSLAFFSFYIADMQNRSHDELTVWATGVKIHDLHDSINSYLEEITVYFVDLCPKVFSHVVQPGSTPSQDPSENTH